VISLQAKQPERCRMHCNGMLIYRLQQLGFLGSISKHQ